MARAARPERFVSTLRGGEIRLTTRTGSEPWTFFLDSVFDDLFFMADDLDAAFFVEAGFAFTGAFAVFLRTKVFGLGFVAVCFVFVPVDFFFITAINRPYFLL